MKRKKLQRKTYREKIDAGSIKFWDKVLEGDRAIGWEIGAIVWQLGHAGPRFFCGGSKDLEDLKELVLDR